MARHVVDDLDVLPVDEAFCAHCAVNHHGLLERQVVVDQPRAILVWTVFVSQQAEGYKVVVLKGNGAVTYSSYISDVVRMAC